ncbi:hypothetical protein BX600DRAFT_137052 [Xylariales sp. PMI_506]|nr:hypothetical protein BX600DRAFT_137052 [Xylariales sp. PMI_506]
MGSDLSLFRFMLSLHHITMGRAKSRPSLEIGAAPIYAGAHTQPNKLQSGVHVVMTGTGEICQRRPSNGMTTPT